ncbi:MAG: ATP-dependent zinc metalloprotease FtsH [Thermodesulfobacteriota bacterium]
MEKRTRFSIWYFLIAFFVLIFLQEFFLLKQFEDITYSEFRKLVQEEKVDHLLISDRLIRGKLRPGASESMAALRDNPAVVRQKFESMQQEEGYFITIRMADPDLIDLLEEHGIHYQAEIESTWFKSLLSWIVPILIFFAIWGFFFKKIGERAGGGLMSIGKSNAKVYVEDETRVTFEDTAGVDEAEEELKEIIEFLKNPAKYQTLGGRIPKGVLLVGPPGTGKTLLARAVAGEAGVPFLSLSGSDFVEMFVGVGAARVRDLFSQAQSKAPSIIFIDELDALGKARGIGSITAGHDEREQTLNQLLTEMDGFDTRKGVIIIAATNRPEILDPALLRPGRFDRQVLVDRPGLKGREAIFRVHSRNVKLAADVHLAVLAARTPGMVGADIANVINEAALLAARKNKPAVQMADFEAAIDRVIAGLEKRNRLLNPKEKEIVAFHEAGHALMAESLPTTDPVHKISIIPRGISALGYTLQLPTEDRYLMTRQELLDRMAVLLGGRAAEEIVFGEVSTGAQNDLHRATDIAQKMVKGYGMSTRFGPITFERDRRPMFLQEVTPPSSREFSEETAKEIDKEVHQLISQTYCSVKETLENRRRVLEKIARRLLEKEVIEGDELRRLITESTDAAP